jgi:hypothetical protein
LLLIFMGFGAPASAQDQASDPFRADPADVESVDAIVAAVYDVISGPAGEARDWDRWRSLYVPEARLIPVGVNREGVTGYQVMTPDEYVDMAGESLERSGFFETVARGINSFQLMNDGTRWWVLTVFWTSERPDLPIPEKYLAPPRR